MCNESFSDGLRKEKKMKICEDFICAKSHYSLSLISYKPSHHPNKKFYRDFSKKKKEH